MVSPEIESNDDRLYRRALDMVANIAGRHALPNMVHVAFTDEATGKKHSSEVEVRPVDRDSNIITVIRGGELHDGMTSMQVAEIIVEDYPNVPLICDEAFAEGFAGNALTWIDTDHYRLEGTVKGVLEVYRPYRSTEVSVETDTHRVTVERYLE